MACTHTNTLVKNYSCIKGSTLAISASLKMAGVPANLAGWAFRLYISSSEDFSGVTPVLGTIASNTYSFSVDTSSMSVGEFFYRVMVTDSLGKIYPEPFRAGRITIEA